MFIFSVVLGYWCRLVVLVDVDGVWVFISYFFIMEVGSLSDVS